MTSWGQARPCKGSGPRFPGSQGRMQPFSFSAKRGWGKNLVASAIHRQSLRSKGPFITVQCSALTESLITSELFGHEKGAFTGATNRRIGRVEMADNGSLFLDEIGDLSLDIQARLLRVLQSKEFERVGGGRIPSPPISGSSPRPTGASKTMWRPRDFAETCTTGSTSSPSMCLL